MTDWPELLADFGSIFLGRPARERTPRGFFSLVCAEIWRKSRTGGYDAGGCMATPTRPACLLFFQRRVGESQWGTSCPDSYDEAGEVRMYDTPHELCAKIERYRDDARERDRMATNAHRRAVPAYSLDCRAARIVEILREFRQANANRQ